jgi:hypothetical protein
LPFLRVNLLILNSYFIVDLNQSLSQGSDWYDLVRKPVPTLRDHAVSAKQNGAGKSRAVKKR